MADDGPAGMRVDHRGGVTSIAVTGCLDAQAAHFLVRQVADVLASDSRRLDIDLSEMTSFDAGTPADLASCWGMQAPTPSRVIFRIANDASRRFLVTSLGYRPSPDRTEACVSHPAYRGRRPDPHVDAARSRSRRARGR